MTKHGLLRMDNSDIDVALVRLRTQGAIADGGEKTEEWPVHPLPNVRYSRDLL